jgi:bifunctional enzyme CysN/CysC
MAVQGVIRPDLDFRGFTGLISSGVVRVGDEVRICPSGRTTRVARIVTWAGDLPEAVAGQSITLTLADEVDVSRGDVIAAAASPPESAERFTATLVWMDEVPLVLGRSYWMKIGSRTVAAVVSGLNHRVDVNTLETRPATALELNEIGEATLRLDRITPSIRMTRTLTPAASS